MRRRQADLEADAAADGTGIAQPLEHLPRGECGFVIAGLERDLVRIDAWLEAHLVDLAHHLAVPLHERVGRHGGIDLHVGMGAQHLALEIDPARALAGLAVGDAVEVRSELLRERAEDLLARAERDAADQMQPLASLHQATFSSFCSERRCFGTGTPGWVLGQLV